MNAETRPASLPTVSAVEPDWSREYKPFWAWIPSRSLLASVRAYQRHRHSNGLHHRLARLLAKLRHRFWSVVTGAEIPLNCQIGGGLMMLHPNGVVVHPDAVIGPNCMLHQQVTVGVDDRYGAPRLGGHVDVGAGAKILGPITVGDHARIGANAVVRCDVPDYATAVGVPARCVLRQPR